MFLHSCQDETGQLKVLPPEIPTLRPKYTGGDGCMPEQLLLLLSVCIKVAHGVDVHVPLLDVLQQVTPMLYFWSVAVTASFSLMRNSPVDTWITGQHVQTVFALYFIYHLQL